MVNRSCLSNSYFNSSEGGTYPELTLNNEFRILTGFRNIKDLGKDEKCDRVYSFVQKDVYDNPHHGFFVSDNQTNILINSNQKKIGDIANCVTGIYSGNDKVHLRPISSKVKNSKSYVWWPILSRHKKRFR